MTETGTVLAGVVVIFCIVVLIRIAMVCRALSVAFALAGEQCSTVTGKSKHLKKDKYMIAKLFHCVMV